MQKEYCFELLIIDQNGKTEISSAKSIIYSLLSSEKLWEDARIVEDSNGETSIVDNILTLKIKSLNTDSTLYDFIEAGFLIKISSKQFDRIAKFRYPLILQLKKQSFDHVRILTDDISTDISRKAYPLINELENLLRRYVAKFFTQKIGVDWWVKVIPDWLAQKIKDRANNETVFSKLVQTDLTLINFDDLGEIIYKHKLGLARPDNIADSVLKIKTVEELEKFKADLNSNYDRFFKQNFKDKDFDRKWKQLFKIRNKVAHSNLFTQEDLDLTELLYRDLKEIITSAEDKIDDFKFSLEEQEAIRETIYESEKDSTSIVSSEGKNIDIEGDKFSSSTALEFIKVISEVEFLQQLDRAENSLKSPNSRYKYVGLRSFVVNILEEKRGYSAGPSYALANILKERGVVDIYEFEDDKRLVKAIRRKKNKS